MVLNNLVLSDSCGGYLDFVEQSAKIDGDAVSCFGPVVDGGGFLVRKPL